MSLTHVSISASTATALFWKMPAFCCQRCCLNTKNAELEDGLIQPILVTFTFHPDNTALSIDVVASNSDGKERHTVSAEEVSQITAIAAVQSGTFEHEGTKHKSSTSQAQLPQAG